MRSARARCELALLGGAALAFGCQARALTFLEQPSFDADGWVLAVHRTDGDLAVSALRALDAPFLLELDSALEIELAAYRSFDLPVGPLPAAGAPGTRALALPTPDAVFRAELADDAPTLRPAEAPSAALTAFRFATPTACVDFRLHVLPVPTAEGNTSLAWLPDGSALLASGPQHFRVTPAGLQAFARCGLAAHYSSMRAYGDGTVLVTTQIPQRTALLRFDLENLGCEVLSEFTNPAEGRLTLDENLSGDPSAPGYALTSSGALYRLDLESGWALVADAPEPDPQPSSSRIQLVQFEPDAVAGSFDAPSYFVYRQATGLRHFALPPSPAFLNAPPRVESLGYVAGWGLVVATDWGPIFVHELAEAPRWSAPVHDFRALAKRTLSFRGGFVALVKEGPAVQLYPGEVCLPGTSLSGGGLLSAEGSDHAIVGFFREPNGRAIRWLEAQD